MIWCNQLMPDIIDLISAFNAHSNHVGEFLLIYTHMTRKDIANNCSSKNLVFFMYLIMWMSFAASHRQKKDQILFENNSKWPIFVFYIKRTAKKCCKMLFARRSCHHFLFQLEQLYFISRMHLVASGVGKTPN